MGEKIAERQIPKIFLLNGSHDRETSASKSTAGPMTACDVVLALCDALNRRHAKVGAACKLQAAGPPPATSSALVHLSMPSRHGAVSLEHMQAGQPLDNPPDAYITALLVPKGGAIAIDTASLEAIGIRCKPQFCCYCHSAPMIAWPTPAVHVLPGCEAPDADSLEMPLLKPQSQQL